jgi:hypothetical protein
MNVMNVEKLNVRPHPGPLPRERENHLPSHVTDSDWIGRTISRNKGVAALLLPLLGGEGRGEGERNH